MSTSDIDVEAYITEAIELITAESTPVSTSYAKDQIEATRTPAQRDRRSGETEKSGDEYALSGHAPLPPVSVNLANNSTQMNGPQAVKMLDRPSTTDLPPIKNGKNRATKSEHPHPEPYPAPSFDCTRLHLHMPLSRR